MDTSSLLLWQILLLGGSRVGGGKLRTGGSAPLPSRAMVKRRAQKLSTPAEEVHGHAVLPG